MASGIRVASRAIRPAYPGERMPAEFTIGVEEEYQLVDRVTGALRSRAPAVLAADRTGDLVGEVQESQVEIGTPICGNASEVADSLRDLRFEASYAAAAEEMDILSVGVHPFSGWEDQQMSLDERPKLIAHLFGQLIRQQLTCGLHIHIAIPERHDRARLMNVVREYIPHFLALACSSPLYLGADTGFASFRGTAWRHYPFNGAPPRFESTEEYDRYLEMLIRTGAIPDGKTVYWSIRPSARFPTLEFRMCDACPRLEEAVAIAALARAVVIAAAEGRLRESPSPLSSDLRESLLYENEWYAARDGLDAKLIDPTAADAAPTLRARIAELLDAVRPIAEANGDGDALGAIDDILARGNAADRIRARRAEGLELDGLVEWLVEETRVGTGLDRRGDRREPALSTVEGPR
jgi:glutamate---cysteine ligase / carboxylate-amine ligase